MGADDVVILNEGLEFRTSKTGRTRATVKVTSEPLIHNFDPKPLGKEPAAAIAEFFRRSIMDISMAAAPATIKARQVASRAVKAGKAWALKRYAGGRIGEMEPDQSDRLFNDSGRMAKSIVANATNDDAWRINFAANRLDPSTADRGGSAAVERIYAMLVSLVPAFGDSSLLGDDLGIVRAVKKAQRSIVRKAQKTSGDLGLELAKTLIESALSAFESIDDIAS